MDWYRKRPLLWWFISFSAGIFLSYYIPSFIVHIILILVFSPILFSLLLKNDSSLIIMVVLLWVGFGIFRYFGFNTEPNELLQKLNQSKTSVLYTGIVTQVDTTKYGDLYCLTIPYRMYKYPLTARPVQVWLPTISERITDGDTIICAGTFSEYPQARNPGEFDYKQYQSLHRLYYQFSVGFPWEVRVKQGTPSVMNTRAEEMRNKIRYIFGNALSEDASQFAMGIILGERDQVDKNTIETYSNLGIIHVMAVSGLHVGFVVMVLIFTGKILRIPHRYQVFFVILGLLLYTWLVQFRPSVVRASIMASFLLMAVASEKRYDILNILGFAGLAILLINPFHLFMLGFQLSFLAVAGIILLYKRFEEVLNSFEVDLYKLSLPVQWISGLFLVSLAAFLATIPVTAFHFHSIPVWGLLMNIFVIPIIGFIVINLFIVLITGLAMLPAARFFGGAPDVTITLLNKSLDAIRYGGLDTIHISQFHWGWILVAYACILLFIFWRYPVTKRFVLYTLLLGINLYWILPKTASEDIRFTFMDVGQADAALVELPGKKAILIDAGYQSQFNNSGKKVILPYLKYRGISQLEVFIISHPHSDHMGGAEEIIANIPVKELWYAKSDTLQPVLQNLIRFAEFQGVTPKGITAGFDTVMKNLQVQTLYPVGHNDYDNINNNSLVQKFIYDDCSAIFSGDIEIDVELILVNYDSYLESDILKVPHHGSITSSSAEFIHKVSPKIGVVSVGEENKFDHPSEVVLHRYIEFGSDIHLTRDEGALVLKTGGKQWQEVDWR